MTFYQMSYNKLILLGHLGRDPELRYTSDGKPVCNFSLATTETWKDRSGQKQEETLWVRVVVWGKMAENANKYLSKGRQVYVEGRLKMSKWTDRDGKERVEPEVNASEIQYIGGNDSSSKRDEYDQRRPGTDDHDQRYGKQATSEEALPLGSGVNPDDDIPF